MELIGNYEAVARVEDAVFLAPVLRELKLDSQKWTYSINAIVEGRSGLKHKFDFLVSSVEDPERKIVCMLLKDTSHDNMARITTFYAHSADVAATRALMISESEPALEEKMLSNSLGIATYVIEGQGNKRPGMADSITASAGNKNAETYAKPMKKAPRTRKRKYRDRTRLIHEILNSASEPGGATITRIIFKCNLNYRTAKEIIGEMLKKDLLNVKDNEESKRVYRITKTGSSIMEKLFFYDSVNRNSSDA